MARAAGSGTHYTFVLRDENNGKYRKDVTIALPSSTTIVKQTLANPQLIGWAYRVTRDTISGMVHTLVEAMDHPDQVDDLIEVLADGDMLEEYLKENKLRPDDVRDEAAERGTREHALMERLGEIALRDPEDAVTHAKKQAVTATDSARAIYEWWIETQPWVRSSEQVLPCLRYGYCGTTDLVWEDERGVCVTDLKTRRAGLYAYASDWYQVDSYDLAYEERTGITPARRSVLLAYSDGTYEEVEVGFPRGEFLKVKALWDSMQGVDWTGRR